MARTAVAASANCSNIFGVGVSAAKGEDVVVVEEEVVVTVVVVQEEDASSLSSSLSAALLLASHRFISGDPARGSDGDDFTAPICDDLTASPTTFTAAAAATVTVARCGLDSFAVGTALCTSFSGYSAGCRLLLRREVPLVVDIVALVVDSVTLVVDAVALVVVVQPTKLEARTYRPVFTDRTVQIQRNQHVQDTVNIQKIFPIEERNQTHRDRRV